MFGLGGYPTLPDGRWLLNFLVLLGILALLLYSMRGTRAERTERLARQRNLSAKVALGALVAFALWGVVVFVLGAARVLPAFLADWQGPLTTDPGTPAGSMMPMLDAAVTALVPLAALALVVGVMLRARRRRESEPAPHVDDPPAGRAKLGLLKVIAGIMVFGWVVQYTVLAYWRWRMPE